MSGKKIGSSVKSQVWASKYEVVLKEYSFAFFAMGRVRNWRWSKKLLRVTKN